MRLLFILVNVLLIHAMATAQCDLTVERAVIYKDGTSYIEETGHCEVKDGRLCLKGVPKPIASNNSSYPRVIAKNQIVLGTMHVESPEVAIEAIYTEEGVGNMAIASLQEFIRLNIGKRIKIRTQDKRVVEGELLFANPVSTTIRPSTNIAMLTIQSNTNLHLVPLTEIVSMEIMDKQAEKERVMTYVYADVTGEVETPLVSVSYLQKGMSWMPSYHIDILDTSRFELRFDVNILNDITTLHDSQVDLAVGIPSFEYAKVGEPLSTNYRVIEFLSAIDKRAEGSNKSSVGRLNPRSQSMRSYTVESYGNNNLPQIESGSNAEVYIYRINNVNLTKGERYQKRILTQKFDYDFFYRVEIASNEELLNTSKQRFNKEAQEAVNYVWKAMRFTNTSGMPLTTSPVFIRTLDEEQAYLPIGQSSMAYTPANGTGQVDVAITPSIYVLDRDEEISREKDGYYTIIKMAGTVEIVNLNSNSVDIEVQRKLVGELTSSNVDWQAIDGVSNLKSLNTEQVISWPLQVAGNATAEINYEYEVVIRR